MAPSHPLSVAPWQEVNGGTIRHQLTWRVDLVDGRIILASEQGDVVTTDLPLMLCSPDGSGFELNGAYYPGALILWPEDGLVFFNEVGLEDYVCGVLGSEAYASWPLEALKANAVAIRSYTLYSLGKHGTFDLCDTIHCQVYRGLPEEAVFRTAVTATAGEIQDGKGHRLTRFITPAAVGEPGTMRRFGGNTPSTCVRWRILTTTGETTGRSITSSPGRS